MTLRAEQQGEDLPFLRARIGEDGSLVIEGHDLGPATRIVSDDEEHEWAYTFAASAIPALVAVLGGDAGEDVLELLERRYCGRASYELERIPGDTTESIPRAFWSYSDRAFRFARAILRGPGGPDRTLAERAPNWRDSAKARP